MFKIKSYNILLSYDIIIGSKNTLVETFVDCNTVSCMLVSTIIIIII